MLAPITTYSYHHLRSRRESVHPLPLPVGQSALCVAYKSGKCGNSAEYAGIIPPRPTAESYLWLNRTKSFAMPSDDANQDGEDAGQCPPQRGSTALASVNAK